MYIWNQLKEVAKIYTKETTKTHHHELSPISIQPTINPMNFFVVFFGTHILLYLFNPM